VELLTEKFICQTVQMYLEGSPVVKANNETALNYFKKAADKVSRDIDYNN
jgi:hypothetical protein